MIILWDKRMSPVMRLSNEKSVLLCGQTRKKAVQIMADQKLIDEVEKYIDKYYEPVKDDIKMDKEMK